MKRSRILVLIFALAQIFMTIFGGFNGQSSYSTAIITPAGYAFSIWGIILLGCTIYAIYQLLPSQRKNTLFDELALFVSITCIGYSSWIFAAAREWLWTTVFIFMIMLIALWEVYTMITLYKKRLSRFQSILLRGTFGIYIGWATAAIPLNISAALVYHRVIYSDERSVAVYFLFLIATLSHAVWGQWKIGRNYYYTATIIWAFAAIVVGTVERGSTILALISLTSIMIFAGFVYMTHKILAEN